MKVEPPIPVSSHYLGLPKDVVKKVEKLFRVKWSIIILLFYFGTVFFSKQIPY